MELQTYIWTREEIITTAFGLSFFAIQIYFSFYYFLESNVDVP